MSEQPSQEWIDDCATWRGETLTGVKAHWCHDWDGLPVDETCIEFTCCHCCDDEADTAALKATLSEQFEAAIARGDVQP